MKIIFLYLFLLSFIFHFCARTYTAADLEIRKSLIPGAGNGLFAKTEIPAQVVLGQYGGEMLSQSMYDALIPTNSTEYVMLLHPCALKNSAGIMAIDGKNGNIFSRINYAPEEFQNVTYVHLCEPPYTQIRTMRKILKDEELYMDYGGAYDYSFMEFPEVKKFFRLK